MGKRVKRGPIIGWKKVPIRARVRVGLDTSKIKGGVITPDIDLPDRYFVFEDLEAATEVKIHRESCPYVRRRTPTSTTRWHGPYGIDTARQKAEEVSRKYNMEYKPADCCMLG